MNIPLALGFAALFSGGLSLFFNKVAVSNGVYLPPWMLLISLIHIVAALVLHGIQKGPLYLSPRMIGLGGVCGVLAVASYVAWMRALEMGGQGSVIFPLAGLAIIVAVPLSFIFHNEPVTATKLVGLGLGVGSITLLSR